MAKYPFLSDEWVSAARLIYAEAEAAGALSAEAARVPVRVNLVVTDVPFSSQAVNAHVDTAAGRLAIDTGHLSGPDVTVSLDYATARSLFVAGDAQAVLQAFLSGRIKVDGDLTKLLDPRAGIWPASGGAGAGPPLIGDGPSGAASHSTGQQALGTAAPVVFDIAARLQEITE